MQALEAELEKKARGVAALEEEGRAVFGGDKGKTRRVAGLTSDKAALEARATGAAFFSTTGLGMRVRCGAGRAGRQAGGLRAGPRQTVVAAAGVGACCRRAATPCHTSTGWRCRGLRSGLTGPADRLRCWRHARSTSACATATSPSCSASPRRARPTLRTCWCARAPAAPALEGPRARDSGRALGCVRVGCARSRYRLGTARCDAPHQGDAGAWGQGRVRIMVLLR